MLGTCVHAHTYEAEKSMETRLSSRDEAGSLLFSAPLLHAMVFTKKIISPSFIRFLRASGRLATQQIIAMGQFTTAPPTAK